MRFHGLQVLGSEPGKRLQQLGPDPARDAVSVLPDADGAEFDLETAGDNLVTRLSDEIGCGSVHDGKLRFVIRPVNHQVARRNVPNRNLWRMDERWKGLREPWERLRWARAHWQDSTGAINPTAADAALSMGIRPNTYAQYERRPDSSRHVPIGHQEAIRFGRKYGVRWEWLLLGNGEPLQEEPEPSEPIKRAMSVMKLVPREQQEAIANAIEALVKSGTTDR